MGLREYEDSDTFAMKGLPDIAGVMGGSSERVEGVAIESVDEESRGRFTQSEVGLEGCVAPSVLSSAETYESRSS